MREQIECDVVIVGAGPAGLACAIRIKQLNGQLSVMVLEKGAEVGAHILSGAVVDPSGIDALLPGWRSDQGHPFDTPVVRDEFLVLGERSAFRIPNFVMPRLMSNDGNYIVSLGTVCKWLATKAEELGVDIFPGFAATEVLYEVNGSVAGIASGDVGVGKDAKPKANFSPGIEIRAKYTIIAEGARGSLAKRVIGNFGLDDGKDPPKFGIGFKELWEVRASKHRRGLVQHSIGWPMGSGGGQGGSFVYHLGDNRVAVGFVVHLNYENPWLSPFEEFQQFKTHRVVRDTLEGGKRVAYGARAITEGGWQSVPRLSFPGGALIGCSAGLVNVPRIKGSHNAVHSGMLAAEEVCTALAAGRRNDEPAGIEEKWRDGAVGRDLKRVRNVKPLWSRFGPFVGNALGGLDMWAQELTGRSVFGTLRHYRSDAECLKPAALFREKNYPKPDGVLTFDKASSVYLSNTNHGENQPLHLRVIDENLQRSSELATFAGPSTRYCPAGVYEWTQVDGEPQYVVNAQNCIHCKTCDIKDPNLNIEWFPPESGGGPIYPGM